MQIEREVIMFDFLKPHYYYNSIHEVPISFYSDNNVKGVLFDIDNTLEPYATELPSEKTRTLFDDLGKNGIKVAVVSNNHEPRVKAFCEPLKVIYSFDSGKPSSQKINMLISKLNLQKDEVIIVGDQLFTDIWAANNSGIRGLFVNRINSDESFFIKFKRMIEVPFVAAIKKKGYGRIK